jgi:hypothetical protein
MRLCCLTVERWIPPGTVFWARQPSLSISYNLLRFVASHVWQVFWATLSSLRGIGVDKLTRPPQVHTNSRAGSAAERGYEADSAFTESPRGEGCRF